MSSSKAYLDFILDQLSALDGVTWRGMMGEYILYYNGKIIGGIYDDRLLLKPVEAAKKCLPEAALEAPYDGAANMLRVDEVDNWELLTELVKAMEAELPLPKRRLTSSVGARVKEKR